MAKTRRVLTSDPFNNNVLEVDLSYEKGINYGAMDFLKVNGRKVSYPRILGTRKMGYAFTIGGNWQIPSSSEILCYRKYDGSNILAYRYWDADGEPFISYKVRLWPHVRGVMVGKWKEMLAKHAGIRRLFADNPDVSAFSFEMYGKQHPHLIRYPNDLDVRLLFGVKRDGEIVVVRDIDTDVPKAELLKTVNSDYVWNYIEMQAEFEAELKPLEGFEGMMTGHEGAVWYCRGKRTGQWRIFKCKPASIEAIHWGNFPIPKLVLTATAKNILEVSDQITEEDFEAYLAEEYTEHQIAASKERMLKVMARLNQRAAHRAAMREKWGGR